MVAKLKKEPPSKRTKVGDASKPSSPVSRSTIKQINENEMHARRY